MEIIIVMKFIWEFFLNFLRFLNLAYLPLSVAVYRYYGGWAEKINGSTIPFVGDYFCYTRHGVFGWLIFCF